MAVNSFARVVCAALVVLCGSFAAGDPVAGTVYCDTATSGCSFTPGIKRDGRSWGWFDNTVNATGWATLTAVASPTLTSYALGYLEGVLTAGLIYPMYQNYVYDSFGGLSGDTIKAIKAFVDQNTAWVLQQVRNNPASLYWQRVGSMYDQMNGMAAGYNSVAQAGQTLTLNDFALLSGMADTDDVTLAVNASLRPHMDMTEEEIRARERKYGHCTSFVRFTAAMDQLFAGHNTWTTYTQMLRIFKYYTYSDVVMAFSSYPGCLTSTDDFFQLSTGLVVMETTLNVYNGSLYAAIVPQAVFSWTRTMVANRLAKNATHWVSVFSQFNSGTYNNMWIVVNYNLFSPGKPLKDNTLVIAEQLPGLIVSGDVTPHLWMGTFQSYNRAYFSDIAKLSGAAQMVQRHGAVYSFQGSSRAKIFRRDADSVNTIEEFQRFLRYNDYQTDPFSMKDPSESIAARYDLMKSPEAGGAIDVLLPLTRIAKCTSSTLLRDMKVLAVSGPTWDSQPVFEWTSQFPDAHYGQPQRFQFNWIVMDSPA